MDAIPKLGNIGPLEEIPTGSTGKVGAGEGFANVLKDAVLAVDELQHGSETAQLKFAKGENVELHDVLIQIEEAEVAFKTMMGVRNKLVEAYREVMRMGS